MKLRSLAVGLAIIVASSAALAGCGDGPAGPSTSPTSGGSSSTAVTTLEFWQNQFSDADNAWFKEHVDAFNASHTDIKVNLTVVNGDVWDEKLKAAQATGTAPDMYTMNYSAVPMKARNGEIAPITSYIAQSAWDDLDARFLKAVTVGNDHYAYPIYYEPSAVLLMRKSIVTAAGLDITKPPTTWAQLIDWGLAIKKSNKDVVPYQMGQNAVELAWSTWGMQYGTAGHLPISDDWSKSAAADPKFTPLFQFVQDLQSKGVIAEQPLAPYGDVTPLGEGKLAMMANGSWGISALLANFPDVVSDVAVVAMPTVDGDASRCTATLGGWTIGVDAKSTKAEAAAKVISWMLAEDTSIPKDYFAKTLYTKLSPRNSVAAELSADPGKSVDPFFDVLVNATKSAILEPGYDWQVSLAFGTALEAAMKGEKVAKAQADADAAITKLIADLKLADKPH